MKHYRAKKRNSSESESFNAGYCQLPVTIFVQVRFTKTGAPCSKKNPVCELMHQQKRKKERRDDETKKAKLYRQTDRLFWNVSPEAIIRSHEAGKHILHQFRDVFQMKWKGSRSVKWLMHCCCSHFATPGSGEISLLFSLFFILYLGTLQLQFHSICHECVH